MRVRTWSACVALAWGILLIVTAAGPIGSLRPAQATTRIASSTSNTSTTTRVTLTNTVTSNLTFYPAGPSRTAAAASTAAIARPAASTGTGIRAGTGTYAVQPGDSLSGIAAALGTPGGWPALYAANRQTIGPDPGLIRPGTVLALPGRATPHGYRVAAGDTLSGIAAALAVHGGWPALYRANQRVIGPDPNAIRAGIVLAIPRPASTTPTASQPAPPASQSAPPTAHPAPTPTKAPASAQPSASARPPTAASGRASAPASALAPGGLPRWLEIVLVAAGLLIVIAFLTEPATAIARRRRAVRPAAAEARIVLADYERLVVTHSSQDGTVYVLRPPDADPQAILLAARLVLAQDRYEELAGHLGVPAHWPRE
jgi:LysM repeat protein